MMRLFVVYALITSIPVIGLGVVLAGTFRSIVDVGHNLSMRVVAEGIETETVLATLREYDCDVAQGFFLARPMPAASLDGWLAAAGKQSRR